MNVVIEYVGKPKKKKRHPRILSTQEVLRVEQRLLARPRHPRSKVITDAEIMKSEERMFRQQLVRSVEES